MEYKNDRLGVSFTIPDKITVRKQLEYQSLRDGPGLFAVDKGLYERLWTAAKVVIQDWQCEHVALDADLGQVESMRAADCISYAGRAAFTHMLSLDELPKNS